MVIISPESHTGPCICVTVLPVIRAEEVIQVRPSSAQRVVRHHEVITDKRVLKKSVKATQNYESIYYLLIFILFQTYLTGFNFLKCVGLKLLILFTFILQHERCFTNQVWLIDSLYIHSEKESRRCRYFSLSSRNTKTSHLIRYTQRWKR